jgi:hypothetical protein
MFRPTASTVLHHVRPINVRFLARGYADKKPPAADEPSGEYNGPLYNNVQPLTTSHPGKNNHTTRKTYELDFQANASRRGMREREAAEKSEEKRIEQSGGGTTKVSWDEEFPKKPEGPIIGMQDERGGIKNTKK